MPSPAYPRRLIEVDLPIKRISAHARREKSIRHGHISTLHIWWARRPLAACRAVICAALWPDPADPLCPQSFRDTATQVITEFARRVGGQGKILTPNLAATCSEESAQRWALLGKPGHKLDPKDEAHWNVLRFALLDFIADFANWDNSTVPEYLETARALTQAAHEALGGEPGTRPLVVDPFAGGGSIPLEALRVGADAFASDLNPVAVLLNKVVLEYIPKYGQRLTDEVRKWSQWVKEQAEKELASFYPKDPDGATPIAYLWARTITCEGPGCGVTVPLVRTMQISHDGRRWFFDLKITKSRQPRLTVRSGGRPTARPTIAGGSATCPRCQYTTPAKSVRRQLADRNGGAYDATLLAVYVERNGCRHFRDPTARDLAALEKAKAAHLASAFPTEQINPVRPYKNTRGVSAVTRIGIASFCDLYTSRQALAISCFGRLALRVIDMSKEPGIREALATLLYCAVSRFVFQNCSISRWNASRSTIEGAFGKQALQIVWDFAEANVLSSGPANWDGAVDWIVKVIESTARGTGSGTATRAPAQRSVLPEDSVQVLCTDPPYFAAIPYADLSNVFYVWERELYQRVHPDLYDGPLVDQQDEIIVTEANRGRNGQVKSPAFFQKEMTLSLSVVQRAIANGGIGVVVFADSTTDSWEAILGAIINAGWSITGSWPIDTERQARTKAAFTSALQSSVHIVCRPRETPDTGDWRDVLVELPNRIHDWMPRLASEGIIGADAIFACLGPALEIFSRYAKVEKATGERVELREYLEHVWAAVAKEALSMIFAGADATGFDPDARLTAMWFWTLSTGSSGNGEAADEAEGEGETDDEEAGKAAKVSGYVLEYDAARKIAQGLGAHLEQLSQVVEVKGDKARLLPVSERARHLFGKDEGKAPAKRGKKVQQRTLFDESGEDGHGDAGWGELNVPQLGSTVLDRLHQSMVLFGAGRSEALKRFLVEEGVGRDTRFWRLAQALSALYPPGTEEKRWVDGVLARKKGLGF